MLERKDFHVFYIYREHADRRLFWNSRDRVWDRWFDEATAYTLSGARRIQPRLTPSSWLEVKIGVLENGDVREYE
jgi:hypothetical protein